MSETPEMTETSESPKKPRERIYVVGIKLRENRAHKAHLRPPDMFYFPKVFVATVRTKAYEQAKEYVKEVLMEQEGFSDTVASYHVNYYIYYTIAEFAIKREGTHNSKYTKKKKEQ